MARLASHFGLQSPMFQSLVFPMKVVNSLTTDANKTYTTDQVLGGFLKRSIGAARTDTLPAAADLCEAIQGVMVGTSIQFRVRNNSSGAFTITIAAGTGGTADTSNTLTIAQSNDRVFEIVFTNVTPGSETYTLYSLGGGTF